MGRPPGKGKKRVWRKRHFTHAKKQVFAPLGEKDCPKCRQERRTQGYRHGKDVWCDGCHENWVRGGCGVNEQPVGGDRRRRPRHKHLGDID